MPTVYLRKDLYDEIVKKGKQVSEFVNNQIEQILKPKVGRSKKGETLDE